ncbi:MAG TPA: hypothetical protein VJ904_10050 [Tichowtungia sp.]|nr:hypothetical protein [Tichowtungia sp.]
MSRSHTTTPYPIAGGCQSISATASSARTSAGVDSQTRFVTIATDEAVHYRLGDSSVAATTSDTFLPANGEHFIRILPGQYVAAIRSSADATVKVSEFAG